MHLYRIEHSGNIDDYADCFTEVIAKSEKEAIQKYKEISDRIIFDCYLII